MKVELIRKKEKDFKKFKITIEFETPNEADSFLTYLESWPFRDTGIGQLQDLLKDELQSQGFLPKYC